MVSLNIGAAADIEIASSDDIQGMLTNSTSKLLGAIGGCKKLAKPLVGSAVITLAPGATTVISMGRPSFGRVWTVTRSTITGGDDHSSVANLVAALYNGDDTNPALGDLVIPGQAIPFYTSNNDQLTLVNSKNNLFWNITNTSVGTTVTAQQIVCTSTAWEYREEDLLGQAI